MASSPTTDLSHTRPQALASFDAGRRGSAPLSSGALATGCPERSLRHVGQLHGHEHRSRIQVAIRFGCVLVHDPEQTVIVGVGVVHGAVRLRDSGHTRFRSYTAQREIPDTRDSDPTRPRAKTGRESTAVSYNSHGQRLSRPRTRLRDHWRMANPATSAGRSRQRVRLPPRVALRPPLLPVRRRQARPTRLLPPPRLARRAHAPARGPASPSTSTPTPCSATTSTWCCATTRSPTATGPTRRSPGGGSRPSRPPSAAPSSRHSSPNAANSCSAIRTAWPAPAAPWAPCRTS